MVRFMTTSSHVSGAQNYNNAIQEAIAALEAEYNELVNDQNGIDHDATQIAWDQSHINAKTQVRDTHHELGPDGKTHIVYTYRNVNKYSDTQIKIWQNDIALKEFNQDHLKSDFNKESGDLKNAALALIDLIVKSGKAKSQEGSTIDLNQIVKQLSFLFKEMNAKETNENAALMVDLSSVQNNIEKIAKEQKRQSTAELLQALEGYAAQSTPQEAHPQVLAV
jgi:hypothetical protein